MWAHGCVAHLRREAGLCAGPRIWSEVPGCRLLRFKTTPRTWTRRWCLPRCRFSSGSWQRRNCGRCRLLGWHLNRSGQIPDRFGKVLGERCSSLGAAAKGPCARGCRCLFFLEGSRTPDGQMQEFMAGAAYLAIRAQVPLVPIALSGVYDLLPMHTHHFYPGKPDDDCGGTDPHGGHDCAPDGRAYAAAADRDRWHAAAFGGDIAVTDE